MKLAVQEGREPRCGTQQRRSPKKHQGGLNGRKVQQKVVLHHANQDSPGHCWVGMPRGRQTSPRRCPYEPLCHVGSPYFSGTKVKRKAQVRTSQEQKIKHKAQVPTSQEQKNKTQHASPYFSGTKNQTQSASPYFSGTKK